MNRSTHSSPDTNNDNNPHPTPTQALLVAFLLLVAAAIHTVLALELPACRSSALTLDHPRAFFTRLETPAPPSAIPPAWSLFLPLNALAPRSVYMEEVPERPSLLQQIIIEMEDGELQGSALDDAETGRERRRRRRRRQSRGSAAGSEEAGGRVLEGSSGSDDDDDDDDGNGDGDGDAEPLVGAEYRRLV